MQEAPIARPASIVYFMLSPYHSTFLCYYHTYSLVFKKLSFVLADRLYALGLFVTQSPFVPECLVLHPERDREDLREERRHSIQSVLSAMKRQSPTIVSFESLAHKI